MDKTPLKHGVNFQTVSADPNNNNDTLSISFDILSDIGVIALHEPIDACNINSATVIAEIENFGDDTVNTYSVSYKLGSASPVTEVVNTSLAPGDTYNHTFSTPVNLSTTVDSVFEIQAYTTYSNDADNSNDSIIHQVLSRPSPGVPVTEMTRLPTGHLLPWLLSIMVLSSYGTLTCLLPHILIWVIHSIQVTV